jgi:hypothetical protein
MAQLESGSTDSRRVVRIFRLGEEPRDDLRETMTAEDRLRLLRRLTERSWALAGKPLPSVPRNRMPIRIKRST